ncbi:MAG: hypothetical protein B0W54_08885 [Cellvibrio sp. 79]|nr:MAG: hypothetical protein B0W54_08885 [Cellvibrio sp. 79]
MGDFYQNIRAVGAAIQLRKAKDTASYLMLNPDSKAVPETVVFTRLSLFEIANGFRRWLFFCFLLWRMQ